MISKYSILYIHIKISKCFLFFRKHSRPWYQKPGSLKLAGEKKTHHINPWGSSLSSSTSSHLGFWVTKNGLKKYIAFLSTGLGLGFVGVIRLNFQTRRVLIRKTLVKCVQLWLPGTGAVLGNGETNEGNFSRIPRAKISGFLIHKQAANLGFLVSSRLHKLYKEGLFEKEPLIFIMSHDCGCFMIVVIVTFDCRWTVGLWTVAFQLIFTSMLRWECAVSPLYVAGEKPMDLWWG